MRNLISGEQPFQVLATNFSIGPSSSGYDLQISADGINYSTLFSVGSDVTRMVTGVASGSFYKLSGNTDDNVVINWQRQCNDGQGGGGTGPQGPQGPQGADGMVGPQGPQGPAGEGSQGGGNILKAVDEMPEDLDNGDVYAMARYLDDTIYPLNDYETWNGNNLTGATTILMKGSNAGYAYVAFRFADTDHPEDYILIWDNGLWSGNHIVIDSQSGGSFSGAYDDSTGEITFDCSYDSTDDTFTITLSRPYSAICLYNNSVKFSATDVEKGAETYQMDKGDVTIVEVSFPNGSYAENEDKWFSYDMTITVKGNPDEDTEVTSIEYYGNYIYFLVGIDGEIYIDNYDGWNLEVNEEDSDTGITLPNVDGTWDYSYSNGVFSITKNDTNSIGWENTQNIVIDGLVPYKLAKDKDIPDEKRLVPEIVSGVTHNQVVSYDLFTGKPVWRDIKEVPDTFGVGEGNALVTDEYGGYGWSSNPVPQSADIAHIVKITESAYDALVQGGDTDPNTLYLVVEDPLI